MVPFRTLPSNLRCSLDLSDDSAGLIGAPCITFSRCASGCYVGWRQMGMFQKNTNQFKGINGAVNHRKSNPSHQILSAFDFQVWPTWRLQERLAEASPWCINQVHGCHQCQCSRECSPIWRGGGTYCEMLSCVNGCTYSYFLNQSHVAYEGFACQKLFGRNTCARTSRSTRFSLRRPTLSFRTSGPSPM